MTELEHCAHAYIKARWAQERDHTDEWLNVQRTEAHDSFMIQLDIEGIEYDGREDAAAIAGKIVSGTFEKGSTLKNLTPNQQELAKAMSAISEECYCAGWLTGLEYTLWRFVTYTFAGVWGRSKIPPADIENLRTLACKIGGWIVWDDGEKFLTFAEWEREHKANDSPCWPEWRPIQCA